MQQKFCRYCTTKYRGKKGQPKQLPISLVKVNARKYGGKKGKTNSLVSKLVIGAMVL